MYAAPCSNHICQLTCGWHVLYLRLTPQATFWSLIMSHIMLIYHRADIRTVSAAAEEHGRATNGRTGVQAVLRNEQGRGGGGTWRSWLRGLRARSRSRRWLGVALLLAAAWVLNVVGISTKAFNFEFKGLAGQ